MYSLRYIYVSMFEAKMFRKPLPERKYFQIVHVCLWETNQKEVFHVIYFEKLKFV